MANTTFDGPVRSRAGFQSIGPGSTVALTLATDLTVADHAGRICTMDPTGTPTAITLPSIVGGTDSASAGPGRDPNNPSTIGTTFELLFIDDFTGTMPVAAHALNWYEKNLFLGFWLVLFLQYILVETTIIFSIIYCPCYYINQLIGLLANDRWVEK